MLVVPFQDHVDDGVLHNGFGIEVIGADYSLYKEGVVYKAWLVNSHEMVIRLPTARSSFLNRNYRPYEKERTRLGGHSETYEMARMVVRNCILDTCERGYYNLRLVFPSDYSLTNAVFSPGHAPFGQITPQVTPVMTKNKVSSQRTLAGIELDIAFRVTASEEEPRRAVAPIRRGDTAAELEAALNGMTFSDDEDNDEDM